MYRTVIIDRNGRKNRIRLYEPIKNDRNGTRSIIVRPNPKSHETIRTGYFSR